MSEKDATPPKATSRVLAFDLMRGYFLISIIINHLNYKSPLSWLTMRGELFVSAAEGFFFLSGIVLGIVRGAKLLAVSIKQPVKLLLWRSLQLYLVYIVFTIGFTLIGWWWFLDNPGLKPGIANPSDISLLEMIWQSLTFQYLYSWVDYLRLYCLFLAVSPLAILLLRKNLWWLLLLISFAIWFIAPDYDWPDSVYLQPYHWQVIFFGGMTIGFYWKQLAAFWNNIKKPLRVTTISLILAVAVSTLAFNIHLAFGGMDDYEVHKIVAPIRDMLTPYFDKENLPVWRLLLFLLWFWAAFWLFNKATPFLKKYLGWLLLPLGTNSLYTYIVSGVIIFFVHLFIPTSGYWLNALIVIGIILPILLMIRKKFLMKIIPR